MLRLLSSPKGLDEVGLAEPMVMTAIMLSQIGVTSVGMLAAFSRIFGA